jgi:hypothetical protein
MWLDAYDWLGGAGKLEEARQTFEMVVSMASDAPCGGLIWMWPDTDPRKNSITVLEAMKAAARLATADARGAACFRATALRLWGWFESVGLIGDDGLVLDHVAGSAHGQMYCCNATSAELGPAAQGSAVHGAVCKPRGLTTWTYNQGMLLGVAVELSELTGDAKYLRVGASVLAAVVSRMVCAEPYSPFFSLDRTSEQALLRVLAVKPCLLIADAASLSLPTDAVLGRLPDGANRTQNHIFRMRCES